MTFKAYLTRLPQRLLQLATVTLLALGMVACGGSYDSDSANNPPQAQDQTKLIVSMTDAEGDFLTYQVDVTNIELVRESGAVVSVLPQTTTIDFAQYVEVTELLTVMDAPSGRYNSASLTLDYTNALVTVQDEEGNPIEANIEDANGDPLVQTTVDIQFNDDEGFVLAPGIPAHITLDFDLDASNDIVIESGLATVIVSPVLIADTILEEPKTFRLRGLLGEVTVDAQEFDLALRPFRIFTGGFGEAQVNVTGETTYEIDGEIIANEEGLQALAAKDVGASVVTEGYWDKDLRAYIAEAVYAGSSVPWDGVDILRGTVVAREANTLSVRGAIVQTAEGKFIFNDTIRMEVSDMTNVIRRRDGEVTIDQISVGSAIYATGNLSDDTGLDASEGLVRIHSSNVTGLVVSASPLILDVSFINGRRAAIYDFEGTGTSVETDADPDNYEIFTGTLDLSRVDIGDPIRTRGFVNDFGAAPEDLLATTVIDAANVRGHMVINYGVMGSSTAVTSIDEQGLQLNVDEAQFRHHIVLAGIPINLKDLDQTPLVVPGDERGIYSIWVRGRSEVYTFYSAFVRALAEDVEGGANMVRFDAHGYYDGNMSTFTSRRLRVMLDR